MTRWRHVKLGTVYTEIGRAELQDNSIGVFDGETIVIYCGENGKLWARRDVEFDDGRFERLPCQNAPETPAATDELRGNGK